MIRRADGLFGYQLVVVVDDLDMGVDDIVRGRDLLRSTALQMWIRQCLLAGGFEPECGNTEKPLAEHPEYAHLPLIDNAAGRRLAKRERSLDMGALRARNVTPSKSSDTAHGCCVCNPLQFLAKPPICWQISAGSHCAPTTGSRAETG